MAKLYFRYGAMSSAKTLNLLAVAHNYEQKGMKSFVIKPQLDDRFGVNQVRSRAGLERLADLLVTEDSKIDFKLLINVNIILVDEAQFLSPSLVDQLRQITLKLDIPVICYGLRTDFRTHLFAGSCRLLEIADTIEEVKTICSFCEAKAVFNMKFLNGKPTTQGPSIELGGDEKYLPACAACYFEMTRSSVALNSQESSPTNISSLL